MAKPKVGGLSKGKTYIPGPPKRSRQGQGGGTKYAARKKYRGQGKG
jgi:hypothetical protein